MATKKEIHDEYLKLLKKGWDLNPALEYLESKYPSQKSKVVTECADTLFFDILGLPTSQKREN